MKVEVYAVLKEYFEKEFTLQRSFDDIHSLRSFLISENPQAEKLLNISRFAVDNEFVDNNYSLKENDHISIMPPSSGG
ncbi:MoaD/ThiS family protein [Paradesertivirga mongoliensis]|uniref:MoaD/ThiS family protein n=1 Tax=Paradesertivirga mongoliensis TaxID=2100740 RepID=A0ABW4ZMJ2_9SPHI|nr:MoaD/ThiS family protein [Pedobacter mongoliensis]